MDRYDYENEVFKEKEQKNDETEANEAQPVLQAVQSTVLKKIVSRIDSIKQKSKDEETKTHDG